MNGNEEARSVIDVSGLPTIAFGPRNITWLGNLLYMTIEGVMFALVIASYFYLRTRSETWPPAPELPPYLWYGLASGIVLLLSIIPARLAQRNAFRQNRSGIQISLIVLALFGAALIILRIFEFTALNCSWTTNGYASCIWVLLGLHSGHLATEWIETLSVLGISFTDKLEGTRVPDVAINSDYWYFVVITGIIADFIIYGTTRLM
ncbi:MAG TPA: hypothetical protein VJ731_14505 [Terriglobales bacterium]|nr:hypothetical protein [Terriglobales bacterium]